MDEEISPEEAARRLAQLPSGALPSVERYLRGIAFGEPEIVGEIPDLPDGFTFQALPGSPQTVPLTIYIGEEKHIVGTATVIGRKVHAQITSRDGRHLEQLVQQGIIDGVSVYFSTVGPAMPAHPVLPFEKDRAAEKAPSRYNFEPTSPDKWIPKIEEFRQIEKRYEDPYSTGSGPFAAKVGFGAGKVPRIEGLTADHTEADEEPFQDRFPYGPK
jgi:hypothetical protein